MKTCEKKVLRFHFQPKSDDNLSSSFRMDEYQKQVKILHICQIIKSFIYIFKQESLACNLMAYPDVDVRKEFARKKLDLLQGFINVKSELISELENVLDIKGSNDSSAYTYELAITDMLHKNFILLYTKSMNLCGQSDRHTKTVLDFLDSMDCKENTSMAERFQVHSEAISLVFNICSKYDNACKDHFLSRKISPLMMRMKYNCYKEIFMQLYGNAAAKDIERQQSDTGFNLQDSFKMMSSKDEVVFHCQLLLSFT